MTHDRFRKEKFHGILPGINDTGHNDEIICLRKVSKMHQKTVD